MGTNYYWSDKEVCQCCKRPMSEELHIGKSSYGWCFSLHVIPEMGINDLPDWRAKWEKGAIRDEYGEAIIPDDMEQIITKREHPRDRLPEQESAEWYAENHACPGPNGLARHKADGSHCIGNGAGTWDLITGEFS